MLLFISGGEIIIVILFVVIFFGANKIPELAKGLGKGMKEFKKATDDIKREIKDEADIVNKVKDFKDDITKNI